MRKDFPLSGFYEARYNNTLKCVVFEEIQFLQEYRLFNFSN
jgi:NADH-quinone oxidoreductase subunit C